MGFLMNVRRKKMNLNKNKKEYLVCRVDDKGEEGLAYLDPYSGNLSFFSTFENATRLESLDEAREILKTQETLAKILKRDDAYKILEVETNVSEVEG